MLLVTLWTVNLSLLTAQIPLFRAEYHTGTTLVSSCYDNNSSENYAKSVIHISMIHI